MPPDTATAAHVAGHIAQLPSVAVEFGLLYLIPLLPAIGAVINATLGLKIQNKLGKNAVHTIALAGPIAAFVIAVMAFLKVAANDEIFLIQRMWTWIGSVPVFKGATLTLDFTFAIDRLGAVMLLVVSGVGSLVHVFSTGYMKDERPYWRFFAGMNLFMAMMLILVMGDSFLLMFVGWEGVGLCSWLLIGYYYEDIEKAEAAMKAFVVNRIGDFAFVAGLLALFWGMGEAYTHYKAAGGAASGPAHTLVFRELAALVADPKYTEELLKLQLGPFNLVTLSTVMFFGGAAGKSAQIPLYVWLPDAMAGPTPVSALIHAATMVTAGVYMVARLNFLYALSPVAMTVVATVGAVTALFAATIGFFQTDIKKVLAYSTVSQLGYMFIGVGVGAYAAGIFHLMTHAFFKACLFLGSGAVIASMHHRQDMKDMGGLAKHIPWTYRTFFISTLAIAGVPGLAGFFSKDEILWKAFDNGNTLIPGWFIWGLGAVAAGFTAFYMFRLTWQIFSGEYRGGGPEAHGHDAHGDHGHHGGAPLPEDWRMSLPLIILAFLALAGGYVGVPSALGGNDGFHHFLAPTMAASEPHVQWLANGNDGHGSGLHSHMGEYVMMAISVLIAGLGILLATKLYYKRYRSPDEEKAMFGLKLWTVLYNKYFVDEGYFRFVIHPFVRMCRVAGRFDNLVIDGVVNLAGFLMKILAWISGAIDRHFVDGAVLAAGDLIRASGSQIRRIQTGRIQNYVLGVMAGSMALILVVILMQ